VSRVTCHYGARDTVGGDGDRQDEQKVNKSNNPSLIIREASYLLMHNALASVVVRWVMQHARDPSSNALFRETECQGLPSQQ